MLMRNTTGLMSGTRKRFRGGVQSLYTDVAIEIETMLMLPDL